MTVQIFSREVEEGLPRWLPSPTVQANSAGEFRFAELLPGSYKTFNARMDGQRSGCCAPGIAGVRVPPLYYPGVTEPSAAGCTIELDAGQTVQADLTIRGSPITQCEFRLRTRISTMASA